MWKNQDGSRKVAKSRREAKVRSLLYLATFASWRETPLSGYGLIHAFPPEARKATGTRPPRESLCVRHSVAFRPFLSTRELRFVCARRAVFAPFGVSFVQICTQMARVLQHTKKWSPLFSATFSLHSPDFSFLEFPAFPACRGGSSLVRAVRAGRRLPTAMCPPQGHNYRL